LWKNIAEPDRPQEDDEILRRNFAVCMLVNKGKNTDKHTHTQTHTNTHTDTLYNIVK